MSHTATRGSRWTTAVAVTVAAGVVRLLVAALTPLFPDETYYWVWSRHLAPGYFDHPPMTALLIRAGTLIGGDTPLGVRLACVLATIVGAYVLALTARRLGGNDAALRTAVIFAVMPLAAAGLVLATPDAPLLAGASATIYALVRAFEHPTRSRASLRWWCVAGVFLGLTFDSKYMAVLIPLGVVVACATRRGLRERFREPGPYVATAIAAIIFSPVVIWNARHHWASFAFQLQHGFSGGLASALNHELELLGGQLGLVSPILFVLCVIAIVRALRARGERGVAVATRAEESDVGLAGRGFSSKREISALLAIIAITVFAFFMYSATRRRVEANWPALAWVPAVLLLASTQGDRRWTRWLNTGIVLAAMISLVAYVDAFTPILPVRAGRDPAARAVGWDSVARATSIALARASSEARGRARTHVAADRYQDASELAFHLPGHPEVFALNLVGRPNQYDFWPGFPDRAQVGDALILQLDDGDHPAAIDSLRSHFSQIESGPSIALARNGDVIKRLRLWTLSGWRGTWPRAQLRSPP